MKSIAILKTTLQYLVVLFVFSQSLLISSCSFHVLVFSDGTNSDRANDLLSNKTTAIKYKDGMAATAYHVQIRQDSIQFIEQTSYKPIRIPTSEIESLHSRNHWAGATTGFFLGMVGTAVTLELLSSDSESSLFGVYYFSLGGGIACGVIGGISGVNTTVDFSSSLADTSVYKSSWRRGWRK